MKSAFVVLASGLIVVALSNGAHGDKRTWTDASGKYTVRAELVQFNERIVTLRLPNSKELAVQVEQLSKADQQFVQNALEVTKPAVLAAKAGTAPAASSVVATQVEEPKEDVAKRPFALFDIKPGMTDRDVANVFRRKGIPPAHIQVRYQDSATNKFAGARQQKFVHSVKYYREKRSGVFTSVNVSFSEDLPDRPGLGICHAVSYTISPGSETDLPQVAHKVLGDLISRYGEPTTQTDNSAVFGDEKAYFLEFKRNFMVNVRVLDVLLQERLQLAKQKIEAIKVPAPFTPHPFPLDF